tara:strand:- start:1960 stop:2220 length:261 start_codon:yes stop_codon:yes gene_type:complete
MLRVEGFEDAVIGLGVGFERKKVLVYDVELILKQLMERDGMSEDEAFEFFEFNILGRYKGDILEKYKGDGAGMPTFLFKDSYLEDE